MSSLVEDIMGNGLRVLLLGSYDDTTKEILHNLQSDLDKWFERYSCTTLLLENLEVHVSLSTAANDYSLFFEKDGRSGVCMILKDKTKPIERIEYEDEEDFRNKLGIGSGTIDFKQFRQVTELEKVAILNEWADVVYLIKHLENTRGGELVELTYLLSRRTMKSNHDPLKYEFFYKHGIAISTMVKEIVANNKIAPLEYDDYNSLRDTALKITSRHISRLNTEIGRFRQFE